MCCLPKFIQFGSFQSHRFSAAAKDAGRKQTLDIHYHNKKAIKNIDDI